MAYANWGAKVWKKGKARHDRCDVSLRDTDIEFDDSNLCVWFKPDGHAIVGDIESKFVFVLHKYYINSILIYEKDKWKLYELPPVNCNGWILQKEDKKYKHYTPHKIPIKISKENGRTIEIEIGEWKAICGQNIGEGFEDWE